MNNVPKIMVKSEGIAAIGSYAASLWSTRKIVLLSDKKSFDAEGAKVLQYLTIMGFDVQTLVLNEPLYTTAIANLVYQFLSDQKITKENGIVGLGDEFLCQLSGYVSENYLGGLPLIQIPTTLRGQLSLCTDNYVHLLNLEARTFHSLQSKPEGILIDTNMIDASSENSLKVAQEFLLAKGFPQSHMCQHELCKKRRIEGHQIDYTTFFSELADKNLIPHRLTTRDIRTPILRDTHKKWLSLMKRR